MQICIHSFYLHIPKYWMGAMYVLHNKAICLACSDNSILEICKSAGLEKLKERIKPFWHNFFNLKLFIRSHYGK